MRLGNWYLGIGLAAMAISPLAANAAPLPDLTGGITGPIFLGLKGVTVEIPNTVGTGANGGSCTVSGCAETTWGAGIITNSVNALNTAQTLWTSGDNGQAIAFVIYDVADESISGTPPNINIANTGATTSFFGTTNGKINIELRYMNLADAPCFASGCGPNLVTPSSRTTNNLDSTPNVAGITDKGSLFANVELIPGVNPADPTETLQQSTNSSSLPAVGSGSFYANCVSGPGCSEFNLGTFLSGVVADFFGKFNLSDNSTSLDIARRNEFLAGWPGDISDPITAFVPEPASMALLGSALTLFGAALRRRRRGKGSSDHAA